MLLQTIILLILSSLDFGLFCEVNLKNDIAKKDPVFLRYQNGTLSLWAPEGPKLEWSYREESILLCSGRSNALSLTNEATNRISCLKNKTFEIESISANIENLECKSSVSGEAFITNEICARDQIIIYLGLNSSDLGFVPYITLCYKIETASVLWTRHVIPGKAIKHSMGKHNRPDFKVAGMPSHVKPNTAYAQENQFERLTVLLGSATQARKYISYESYLSRGHLSPDADGIYTSWKYTTYFYVNVAPQWQVVNSGNWIRIENLARKIAEDLQEETVIFTGSSGILKLPHINGTQIPITIDAGGIEAPRWYWKIISSRVKDAGIAFVTSNNPFETEIAKNEFICENICSETGWDNKEYKKYTKGFTYCCHPNDLIDNVLHVPSVAGTSSILTRGMISKSDDELDLISN